MELIKEAGAEGESGVDLGVSLLTRREASLPGENAGSRA